MVLEMWGRIDGDCEWDLMKKRLGPLERAYIGHGVWCRTAHKEPSTGG